MSKQKIELLAPAGDLEKLKIAILYGADAVYFGGEMFSLRAGSGNFTIEEILEGVEFAHSRGKKAYLTLNIFAHNKDIELIKEYLHKIKAIDIDAYIVSDPGIIDIVREVNPHMDIHLSTQANTTNYRSVNFWYNYGIRRIVLARELTLEEIQSIKENTPQDMQVECFIHGAMCISYSGRCLLSNYMTNRDSNQGMCAHPCRWNYALIEETRPNETFPIEEDERGTYILNSRDLCMIEHIPEIVESGIASCKIEGRMKSVFYVATIVSAYRKAIDLYYENSQEYKFDESWLKELRKVSHREFTTGFYFANATDSSQNYLTSAYTREYDFIGVIKAYDENSKVALVEQRNKFSVGETVEIFGPFTQFFEQTIEYIINDAGEYVDSAPHAQQMISIRVDNPVAENYFIRKKKS